MAISKQAVQDKYAKSINTEEESEALQRATHSLGKEQGTELYNQAKAETIANSIISNTDFLYKTSTDKYKKDMSSLATKGLTLSKEYLDKKISIQNNTDLTVEGKTKQLKELYQTYNTQTKGIIEQQIKIRTEYNKKRGKIADETLQLVNSKSSINDFTDKDLNYILYMADKADNEQLLNLLEQYNFNPFLINIINARDSKESNHKDGNINTDKLEVVHPLAYIRENKMFIAPNELHTDIGTRTLETLIPIDGIPGIDPWANNTNKKETKW